MSYVFDTMRRAWASHIRPLVVQAHGEELAFRFEGLIEEMHSANHDVPSRDGVFKGDGINKDPRVTRAARELEECIQELGRIPKNKDWPSDAGQCDGCGGHGCGICEGKGWLPKGHVKIRLCENEACAKPLPPSHVAVYCSNQCAADDA